MMTFFDCVAGLSEQDLLDHFAALVARDRSTTAELLVAIAEIDERKLWASHACSSMFTFCMERFHMSEQVTAKRLWAARTARRFPVVLEMVARGELHLGAVHLLARHLTEDNHARVLDRARHKSSREVEQLIAELVPRADVASRIRARPAPRAAAEGPAAAESVDAVSTTGGIGDRRVRNDDDQTGNTGDRATPTHGDQPATNDGDQTGRAGDAQSHRPPGARPAPKPIVPLSPRRYKIEITVDQATHDKLRSLQDLLGRSAIGRDPAAILSRAIDVLLVRTLARKAGCSDQPKPAAETKAGSMRPASLTPAAEAADSHDRQRSRHIPAAVRREVWQRDCGRCSYVDARGRRCGETSKVEFHHRGAFAMGGLHTPENIELRCAAHNQYQADLDFGRSFMDERRGKLAAAGAFPGECRRAAS